jgi:Tol biopolymer transport system component
MPSRSVRIPAIVAVTVLATTGCAWATRVSQPSAGPGTGARDRPAISADGRYVAYASVTDASAPGVSHGVYRYDALQDTRTLVSRSTAGEVADDESWEPAISADGRYVAFSSDATNLVADDGNDSTDVFVRDLQTNTTTRVSVSPSSGEVDEPSYSPSISADGRYVAFITESDEFTANDNNLDTDAMVIDRTNGSAELASIAGGAQADSTSEAVISGNGQYVAFVTDTDLLASDENFDDDVYRRNLQANSSTRVSRPSTGDPDTGGGWNPSMSFDGNIVAFTSYSDTDTFDDPYPGSDVFVRDLSAGTLRRVSLAATGGYLDGTSFDPIVSSDGNRVIYLSSGNATGTDSNGAAYDAYVRDLGLARNFLVSTELLLAQTNEFSYLPALSGDGRYAAFLTIGDLFLNDGNGANDIYLRAVDVPNVTSISPTNVARGATVTMTINGSNFLPGATVIPQDAYLPTAVTRNNEGRLTATIVVPANAPTGKVSVYVQNPGSGPGAGKGSVGECAKCLTIT